MMVSKKLSRSIIILVITILIVSCSAPTPITPTLAPNTPTPLSTPTSLPTLVSTKISTTETPTLQPTSIPQPTGMPLAADDPLQVDIRNGKYKIVMSTSTVGPKGYVYSAYVLTDSSFKPESFGTNSFRVYDNPVTFPINKTPTPRPDLCRIIFYLWDGRQNFLIRSFRDPFSFMCGPINWNDYNKAYSPPKDDAIRKTLSLQGFWSDINQNGLPEFTMYYQFCSNGCLNYGRVKTYFYEIQDTFTVINLTENLDGTILPWDIFHSSNPNTIKIYDLAPDLKVDVSLEFFSLYQWNSNSFVNVSAQFADQYLTYADKEIAEIKQRYGKPLQAEPLTFFRVFVIHQKANIPRQRTLDDFLEITELSHWTGTSSKIMCWLQLARGYAQKDFRENKELIIRPYFVYTLARTPNYFNQLVTDLQQGQYDISACK